MQTIKIVIEEKEDGKSCNVTLEVPKSSKKKEATENEKQTGLNVYNVILNALENLSKEGK